MIATTDEILDKLSKQFEELQSNLECYLNPPEELDGQLISSSKVLYELMKDHENITWKSSKKSFASKELLTKGFDNEQIWQQLQIQNVQQLRHAKSFLRGVNRDLIYLGTKECLDPQIDENGELEEKSGDENADVEDFVDDDSEQEDFELHDEDETEEEENPFVEKKYKPSIVDDTFFKLRQMEEFLDVQDRLEENKRDEKDQNNEEAEDLDDNIDLFDDEMLDEIDDNSSQQLMYKDFFDPITQDKKKKEKKSKTVDANKELSNVADESSSSDKSDHESADEEDEDEDEASINDKKQSAFEKKQDKLTEKISRLEEANISAKPWQLVGETTSKTRPLNSLLEEHVTFDHTSVGAPVITEETTETIEDFIKLRIRDQAWDDVERKVKPTIEPHQYKKAPELNMEKSKLSLAEVYEKEYLKEMEGEKEEKENEDHVLVKTLMDKLFVKLDALSNFYFTPKPAKPEIKIITNAPSLEMEEVTPITMTQSSQMAPEEIYEKKRGDVIGDGEKTAEDRKRERRQKKIKKKFAVKERDRKEALKAKTGVKGTKKKALDQLKKGVRNTIINEKHSDDSKKAVKSSNQFFNKLQDEVTKKISAHKSAGSTESKKKKQKTEHLKL